MNSATITLNTVTFKLHAERSVALYYIEHLRHRYASSIVVEAAAEARSDVA